MFGEFIITSLTDAIEIQILIENLKKNYFCWSFNVSCACTPIDKVSPVTMFNSYYFSHSKLEIVVTRSSLKQQLVNTKALPNVSLKLTKSYCKFLSSHRINNLISIASMAHNIIFHLFESKMNFCDFMRA